MLWGDICWNSAFLSGRGAGDGSATLRGGLIVPCKTILKKNPESVIWCLPKGVENLCPHWNWHLNIYSVSIQHCQTLDATNMSIQAVMQFGIFRYKKETSGHAIDRHGNSKCTLLSWKEKFQLYF